MLSVDASLKVFMLLKYSSGFWWLWFFVNSSKVEQSQTGSALMDIKPCREMKNLVTPGLELRAPTSQYNPLPYGQQESERQEMILINHKQGLRSRFSLVSVKSMIFWTSRD